MNDEEAGRSLLNQAMEFWVGPEIERRQAAGKLERPVNLARAQVVFHPDSKGVEVRINEEVRAEAKIRPARDRLIKKGDAVYLSDVAGIEWIALPAGDSPNSGHLTILRLGDKWYLSFDFVYYKEVCARHISVASEFLQSAEENLEESRLHVFVDNLFSAAELCAKAILLTNQGVRPRGSRHKEIHVRFNGFARLGNVDRAHRDAFNWLAQARASFRYLESENQATMAEMHARLEAVKALLETARLRVRRRP